MKYYEMLDVYRFIKNELKPQETGAYLNYVQKMDKLFEELKPYFPSGKDVVYPPIKEEDYNRISKVFDEAVEASNDFEESYKNIIEEFNPNLPPIHDVTLNLNKEFLSKAYVEYKNIKPNPHFSLKDQMEDFRYLNVEVTSENLKKLGGNQSNRTQMSVKIDGKEVKGVFTNMTHFNGKQKVEAIFPRMIEKYPKYAPFFKSINIDDFYKDGVVGLKVDSLLNERKNPCTGEQAQAALNQFANDAHFSNETRQQMSNFIDEQEFYDACFDFANEIDKVRVPIALNRNVIGMKDGDRIDVRNSAMSGVANLLGRPDLIAKSRPLVIYDEQGKKYQEGTFMEFAKGKDINNLATVDEFRLLEKDDFNNPDVKRQLADLQILDYICGNVDRHSGNMLYEVDPKTRKVINITGIDNDCAFMNKVVDPNRPEVQLPCINSLKVIDAEMAEKVKNLSEAELKATLHGYGLNKKEVDAAWARTLQLKQLLLNAHDYSVDHKVITHDVNNPNITVIKKEDWDNVSFKKCHQKLGNYFQKYEGVAETAGVVFPEHNRFKNRKEAAIAGLRGAMGKKQTSFLVKKAKNAAPWFFASNRYKNILSKVKEYDEAEIKWGDPLHSDSAPKWQKLDELKGAIDTYKREKVSDGFIDENWNVKRNLSGKDLERVQFVQSLDTYVKRVEKEKELALQVKEEYNQKKRKYDEERRFMDKPYAQREKQIQDKLDKEEQEKLIEEQKQNDLVVSQEVSHDIQQGNEVDNGLNNAFIGKEEVDINNDLVEEKEDAKIEDINIQHDLENN